MSSQYFVTNGWDRFRFLGHLSKFQWVSRLGFVTAPTSFNWGQPKLCTMFGRLLGWYIIYRFWGLLPRNRILSDAKLTLCASLAFSYIGSSTVRHSGSGRVPNFVAWCKGWKYGTFAPSHFQYRAPPIFWARLSRWASAHILVYLSLATNLFVI